MKISYKHIKNNIKNNISIAELSDYLFQLGHEHDIEGEIFNFEFTPNRGDCLSINGILRDLNLFYDIEQIDDLYDQEIPSLNINFTNDAEDACTNISFLKVDIKDIPVSYDGLLQSYFNDLDINKNNFFTDISNYISYETGQPIHCYDANSIGKDINLHYLKQEEIFETLLDKTITLDTDDLVFTSNNEVINLAGIIGSKKSSCTLKTKSVIIECAHFNPECLMGKSVKYDINSDAAHKFERFVDPNNHEYIIRRILRIIEKHAVIENAQVFSECFKTKPQATIKYKINDLNRILGTDLSQKQCDSYLTKLSFKIDNDKVIVPTFRNDIKSQNDLAEELARAFGYDNIINKSFTLENSTKLSTFQIENKLRALLVHNGFYEVINNPFTSCEHEGALKLDNPLDSNKKFLRKDLKESLIGNLLYNERRQKESIKLFEISNIYKNSSMLTTKKIGIIASGRVGKNYIEFSKKVTNKYVQEILESFLPIEKIKFIDIPRSSLDTKIKNHITYIEFEINESMHINVDFKIPNILKLKKYKPISEFPCSQRDISFSIKDASRFNDLEKIISNFNSPLLKEKFMFDFYKNTKSKEIKVGFRFIFQSRASTITDFEVNQALEIIISSCLKIDSVSIPGLQSKFD